MTRLVLLAGSLLLLVRYSVDGATTRVTCKPDAETTMCLGGYLDIVCEINGTIETGITWAQPANKANNQVSLDVQICSKPANGAFESLCYESGIPGYEIIQNTLNLQILRIKNFTEKDIGKWSCRDGDRHTTQHCQVTDILVAPKLPEDLKASCTKLGEEDKFNASCTRVDEWGTPPVDLFLSIEDNKQILNTSEGNFSIIRSGIGGQRVTCSLDGPSAVCLTNIHSVQCPSIPNATGTIIGIILGVVVVIVVIVFVAVWWCRKSKHKDDEDIITTPNDKDDKKKADEQRDLMSESRAKEEA